MLCEEFFDSLKRDEIKDLYIFTGPEEWTKRQALDALRKKLLPVGLEQLNETLFEEATAQKIIDCAETLPVMCERRLVIVRDWTALKTRGKQSNAADDETEDDIDSETVSRELTRISEWLPTAPDTCTLIFYMSNAWSGKISSKLNGKAFPVVRVDFEPLSDAALLKWCNRALNIYEKRINVHALQKMTDMIGNDLTRIHAELGKLAAYIGNRPEIAAEDVTAVVSPSIEYKVFLIAEKLLNGKLIEATEAANSALQGANAASLISMLSSQFRRFYYYKNVQLGKLTDADAIRDLDLKKNTSFILRTNKNLVRTIDADVLKECYQLCVDADYSIKSGALRDRATLDHVMLRIVNLATQTT